jgi:hypothetical protein
MSKKWFNGRAIGFVVSIIMVSTLLVPLLSGVAQAKPDAKLDLIFCLDVTGSMWDDIDAVKAAATNIVDILLAGVPDSRVAIVGYRDFGDTVMFEDYSFSSDNTIIITNINSLDATGGGDWEEAVYEALIRAIDSDNVGGWRSGVTKAIILMGDAPPHEAGDGPQYLYTMADVIAAAEAVDPAIVFSIVIGDPPDTTAATKFQGLATGTGGTFFTAENAEDAATKIQNAVEEAMEEAEEEAGAEEGLNLMIIAAIIVIVVIVLAVIYAASRPRASPPPGLTTR